MLENFLLSAHADPKTVSSKQETVYCFVDDTHKQADLFFQDCLLSNVTEMLNRLILRETRLQESIIEGKSLGDVGLMISLSNLLVRLKENTDIINKEIKNNEE